MLVFGFVTSAVLLLLLLSPVPLNPVLTMYIQNTIIWVVKRVEWDEHKNQHLKSYRGISFEEVFAEICNERFLAIIPNAGKYCHQNIFVVRLRNYIYYVPFVEDDDKIFLKTIFPTRKGNKIFSQNVDEEDIC
jgi:hypothetical protein